MVSELMEAQRKPVTVSWYNYLSKQAKEPERWVSRSEYSLPSPTTSFIPKTHMVGREKPTPIAILRPPL